ncbi:Activating transcription factor 7-interacting protein 1 [Armadillidium vulgare]|nr:Activating transcription factor 7-interacting protein 1 [Armadillidium vulgare]
MPDVVTYSCSDSDKYKNLSHDTLHLSNDKKDKNGSNSLFSDNELSFYGKKTMNCDKISPEELTNNGTEEVLRKNGEILVSKCNSSLLGNDSTQSDLMYVNELENSINADFDNVNKNLCKSIVNNSDSNLTNKDIIPNSLLQKSNNVTSTLTNGSPSLNGTENFDDDSFDHSLNSLVKHVPEEKENINNHIHQQHVNDSAISVEPIDSKILSHSSKNMSPNEASLNSTQTAVDNSNHIDLNDKETDIVSCKNELVANCSKIQIENSCDDEISSESVKDIKIDENCKKSEIVSRIPCNSACHKDDLAEPSVKETCSGDTTMSENVERTVDFHHQMQTQSDDSSCSTSSSDNSTLSHSSQTKKCTKTSEEKNLSILDTSIRKESTDSSNLKRKKETSHDENHDYEHGNTKRLKTNHESTNISSMLKGETSTSEKGNQSLPTCSKSNFTPVKQEKCMNPNELYQGLLNDVLADDKEPEVVRSKLQRIKRKDLEDMIIDQVMNKVLYDHEFGYQRELCKRLEQTLEAANKRALRLTQEIESLRNTTKKVASEHKRRKSRLVHPTKVKRSVGIQANKLYNKKSSAFLANSDATIIIPTKYRKGKRSGNSEVSKNKTKIKSEPSDDVSINKSEEDYIGIGKTIEQKLSTLRKDLMNSESKSPVSSRDKNGKLSRKHSTVNGKQLASSNLLSTKLEQESELNNEPKHPAPLPHIPFDEEELVSWKVPPSPVLKVQLRNKSIILSWNIMAAYDESLILSYQLFSYEESKEDPPSTDLWQKIGSVKALELPMACTLTQRRKTSN